MAKKDKRLTLLRGGKKKVVLLSKIVVPDLSGIIANLRRLGRVAKTSSAADKIQECWLLAQDFKRYIEKK